MASRRAYLRLSHLSEDLAGNGERVGNALRQVDEIMVLAAWLKKVEAFKLHNRFLVLPRDSHHQPLLFHD